MSWKNFLKKRKGNYGQIDQNLLSAAHLTYQVKVGGEFWGCTVSTENILN